MNLLPWIKSTRSTGKIEPPHPLPPPPRPRPAPLIVPFTDLQQMAVAVAKSGMFGLRDEAQALSLMLLCQAEGLHPVLALRRYHIIDNKPSMRADALQGEFENAGGAILWHERNEKEVSATFFKDKRLAANVGATDRAFDRYRRIKEGKPTADLARIGELTIVRTIEDAVEKGLATTWDRDTKKVVLKKNWSQSPRQMLHARCLSEGVRAINPGLVAGIYVEDEMFDLPEPSSAEDRVKQATENRLATAITEDGIHNVEPVGNDLVLHEEDVNESNYGEVICHVGKPSGPMLGKKVSEIPMAVLGYLQKHYGPDGEHPRWGDKPNDQRSVRLMDAVAIAIKKADELP